MIDRHLPMLLVLASTYPRWRGDHEPSFVHELCKRLTSRFRVIVLTSRSQGAAKKETLDGVEIERYVYAPRSLETLVYGGGIATHLRRAPWKMVLVPSFIIGQYLAARKILKKERVELIHAHWLLPQGWIARRLSAQANIPFIVTSHGGDLFGLRGKYLSKLKRKVAASSAAMTVVSSAMQDEAIRQNLQPPHLVALPMGADMRGRFTISPLAEHSKDELLFVGRLVKKKGLTHLLNALPEVIGKRPSTRLTIAGFGPEEAALKDQTAQLGLKEHVRFLGAVTQDKLPSLYVNAALMVAPFIRDESGDQEGLPVVLMEAIACGCPVLAGRVAGVDDLFGGAVAEFCIDPNDVSVLAATIVKRLSDPATARARALELRQGIVDRFDWTTIAESYGDLLLSCLNRPRG